MTASFVEFYEYIRRYSREYLTKQRNLSIHTVRYYRDTLNSLIRFLKHKHNTDYTGLSLEMLTPNSLLEYLAWLEKQGNSITTRNRRLAAIKVFVQYLGMINETFVGLAYKIQSIKCEKEPRELVTFLTTNEVEKLLRAPIDSSFKGHRDRLLLILLYETGARAAEIAQLRYVDFIDAENGCAVTITGKGNKTRVIPVSRKVQNHVNAFKVRSQATDFIFSTWHGHISTSSIYKIIREYGRLIGLPDSLHPHTLRHSRAMHWYQSGMALELVAQLLGHAQLSTTRVYAWADVEMKRKAIAETDKRENLVPESNHEMFNWNDENLLNRLCGLR